MKTLGPIASLIVCASALQARQTVPATTYPPRGSTDPEFLWKLLQAGTRPAAMCWRSPTTATYPMDSYFRASIPSTVSRSPGSTPKPARNGNRSTSAALKDPIGANLDRIQIVKGWVDAQGERHERVYDIAVSDGRTTDEDGHCRTPVGNTVDVENATCSNTIGATELIAVWKDPEFDPSARTFYYIRVLETPAPRWTAYDAKYYGVKLNPDDSGVHQERAYTDPVQPVTTRLGEAGAHAIDAALACRARAFEKQIRTRTSAGVGRPPTTDWRLARVTKVC